MKKISLICALVLAVAFVATASAEVLNVKVSGDITARGIIRENYDLSNTANDNQQFLMTTTRVQVDADLSDNVSTCVRLLNERDWDREDNATTDIDLDIASITLKEMLYEPLTLTIGRQEIAFGNALVIGARGDWDGGLTADDYSARNAFDAIRATLDLDPWTVDAIYAKIDETGTRAPGLDTDLYGINASYQFADYNAEAEVYGFAKHDSSTLKPDEVNVLGIRGSAEPIENLTLMGEVAFQFGEVGGVTKRDREAMAVQVIGEYAFDYTYDPTLGLEYTYLSGEEAGNAGDFEEWDPMYEDQVIGEICDNATAFGVNTNIHELCLRLGANPTEALGVSLDYYHFWLDEKPVASATRKADDDWGDELDILLTYDYTEDVQFSLLGAAFWPGKTFVSGNDKTATEVVGTVSVSF